MHLVVADPHAGGPTADEPLLGFLAEVAPRAAGLVLLGDLFTVWLGSRASATDRQQKVLDALTRVRARGVELTLVAGNRDVLVWSPSGLFDRVIEGEALVSLDRPTYVLHGDRIRADDLGYRVLSALTHSRALRAAVRRAPPTLAGRGAASLEARLRRADPEATGPLPLADLTRLGERARAAGAARALVGHFHHERIFDAGVPVHLAPAWFRGHRYLVAEAGELRTETYS